MKYKRTDSVIENFRQLEKDNPNQSLEFGVKNFLRIFTRHDGFMFQTLEEEFGTEKAVELYAKVWGKRARPEFEDLKKYMGIKGDPDMPQLAEMIKFYFDFFGNPAEVAEVSDDYAEVKVVDCPYTTEIREDDFTEEESKHFNDAVQWKCNRTIFENFLKWSNLEDKWLFGFPSQVCRGGEFCRFTFTKKLPKKAKA